MWSHLIAPAMRVTAVVVGFFALVPPAVADTTSGSGFEGAYRVGVWSDTGIGDSDPDLFPDVRPGTTATVECVELTYDDRGGPGVFFEEGIYEFRNTAEETGTLEIAYCWRGFHSFSQARASLTFFANGPQGRQEVDVVEDQTVSGNFTRQGSVSLDVHSGFGFGVIIRGRHGDSREEIRGRVVLFRPEISGELRPGGFSGRYSAQNRVSQVVSFTSSFPTLGTLPGVEVQYDTRDALPLPGGSAGCTGASIGRAYYTSIRAFAVGTGVAAFDYAWRADHGSDLAEAKLFTTATIGGQTVEFAVASFCDSGAVIDGAFSASGRTSVQAEVGSTFGLRVGGANDESAGSSIFGSLALTQFGGPVGVPGPPGCNAADIAPGFGTLDIDDVLTFLNTFTGGCD